MCRTSLGQPVCRSGHRNRSHGGAADGQQLARLPSDQPQLGEQGTSSGARMRRGDPRDARSERQHSREQHATKVAIDGGEIGEPASARPASVDMPSHLLRGVLRRKQLDETAHIGLALRRDAMRGGVHPDVCRPEPRPGTPGERGDGIGRHTEIGSDHGIAVVVDGGTPQHGLPTMRQRSERLAHQTQLRVVRDRVASVSIRALEVTDRVGEDVVRGRAARPVRGLVAYGGQQVGTDRG